MEGILHSMGSNRDLRVLLYSHDTVGLGHLRRSRTIATALTEAQPENSALIVTGSPIAGRFDFAARLDYVRLPGVVKLADGTYSALNLTMPIDEMVRLRGAIISATAREFRPDLVIVDKEAWGFRQELAETLEILREAGTRIVLGIRDVLDDEDALLLEWERKNALAAIERFYDEIWVYGIPEICEPLAGLGLSKRMQARTHYTGYLRRSAAEAVKGAPSNIPEEPYVLVTTGGGGDGAELIDWVLRAYESDPALAKRAFIVFGPFLDGALREVFDRRVAALDGRVEAISFHPQMEQLLAGADGVVAMGGYNTFCEILSMDKPAIIVPRIRPRREQAIRAAAAEAQGLVRMLSPERDGLAATTMSAAIRGLDRQSRPSDAPILGLLDGLETIAERAAYLCPVVQGAH
ncbi:glycosyltransferase [uncultured Maricaulis sp.]|uniref:glycosyltransferase family protein n=1 Tax=uncultured Maricaulis sp. TaxID=174710 RepID=UPI0030DAE039